MVFQPWEPQYEQDEQVSLMGDDSPTQQFAILLAMGTRQAFSGILNVKQRAREIKFFGEPESV